MIRMGARVMELTHGGKSADGRSQRYFWLLGAGVWLPQSCRNARLSRASSLRLLLPLFASRASRFSFGITACLVGVRSVTNCPCARIAVLSHSRSMVFVGVCRALLARGAVKGGKLLLNNAAARCQWPNGFRRSPRLADGVLSQGKLLRLAGNC